jgi:hypothetical protein
MTTAIPGQASVEALVAFASLLAALSVLIVASSHFAEAFSEGVGSAAKQAAVSRGALAVESASLAAPGVAGSRLQGVPVENGSCLADREQPRVRERLLVKISAGADGNLYVEGRKREPV